MRIGALVDFESGATVAATVGANVGTAVAVGAATVADGAATVADGAATVADGAATVAVGGAAVATGLTVSADAGTHPTIRETIRATNAPIDCHLSVRVLPVAFGLGCLIPLAPMPGSPGTMVGSHSALPRVASEVHLIARPLGRAIAWEGVIARPPPASLARPIAPY